MLPRSPREERSKEVRCVEESFLFREIRQIYLFLTRYLQADPGSRRAGSEKCTWQAQGAYCGPWGLLYLRQEPAGSCEHAPRMNQRGYLFSFCRQTCRVWCIRMAIRLERRRKERKRDYREKKRERKKKKVREKDLFPGILAPGPVIEIVMRQVDVRRNRWVNWHDHDWIFCAKSIRQKLFYRFNLSTVYIIYLFFLILHFCIFKNFFNFYIFLYLISFLCTYKITYYNSIVLLSIYYLIPFTHLL